MKNGDYILVLAPENFPGKRYREKYCFEHHLVYWNYYHIIPTKDQIIHHINGDKQNNSISNLTLMSRREHSRMHSLRKGKTFVTLKCPFCHKVFDRAKVCTHLTKSKNKFTFCSRSCAAKYSNLTKKEKLATPTQNVINEYVVFNK